MNCINEAFFSCRPNSSLFASADSSDLGQHGGPVSATINVRQHNPDETVAFLTRHCLCHEGLLRHHSRTYHADQA